jgi:GR25 family glycosyltransferase involved in LPS biosynthesis
MDEGWMGCSHSHQNMWDTAAEEGHEWAIGLEDDIMLAPGVTPDDAKRRVMEAMAKIGGSMDALCLAMSPIEIEKCNGMEGLVRVRRAFGMAGTVLPKSSFKKWSEVAAEAIRTRIPVDVVMLQAQRAGKVYGFFPPIFVQRPGFSDITRCEANYNQIEIGGSMIDKRTKTSAKRTDDTLKAESKDTTLSSSSNSSTRTAIILGSLSAAVILIAYVLLILLL